MATRSTNTMQEALQGLLTSISEMKLMPDADLEWLIQIETIILQKAREPIERMQSQGLTAAMPPGGPQMGGMPGGPPMGGPGMPPPGPPPMPAGVGGGVPGMRSEPMTNPDELRRMFTQ